MINKLSAAAIGLCIACTGASAATFDFIGIADGNGFTDTNNTAKTGGEADWGTIVGAGLGVLDVGSGISVIGSASNSLNSPAYAYFDSGNAGLGVCGNTGNCSPGNDDNVGAIGGSNNAGDGTWERLTLTFSQNVNLTQLLFKAEGHGLFTGNVLINGLDTAINGGILNTTLTGSVFNFDYVAVPPGTPNNATNEFYIGAATVAPVPIPASLPLLVGGLGVMGWMARRRRKA